MPMMNAAGPPSGVAPDTAPAGPGMQGRQQQIVQQLRAMDHERLVMLALQLISRLQELEARMAGGATQGPPPGR